MKKRLKIEWKRAAFGIFFVVMMVVAAVVGPVVKNAVAVPGEPGESVTENTVQNEQDDDNNQNAADGQNGNSVNTGNNDQNGQDNGNGNDQNGQNDENGGDQNAESQKKKKGDTCQQALGAIGWLVCPTTGKLAEAVDWLYGKLEEILKLNPVKAEDGTPIYELWKICLNFANVVFVIFLLVVIYSQLTGLGINNYGVKKALPKMIVVAILVNLSFLICSLMVDVSNVVGNGIRGLFVAVEETVSANTGMSMHLNFGEILVTLLGGGMLAVGATFIAFETGAIWMLIPVVLGGVVAVVIGIVTIALRQAVVMLLIMVAPLAIVAYMLPNTEQWFEKWRKLLGQMLVFYPLFSLLFGASQLAGFAIIASAKDGFGLLLGTAVQIFPLFFSVSLMKMSGNFLGAVNAKLNSMAAGPLATNRAWADRQRELTRARHLAGPARTPSMKLMQFMAKRRAMNEADLAMHQETIKNRGLAYRAQKNYDANGVPTKRGERAYSEQLDNMAYQREILRDQNTFNKGLAYRAPEGSDLQRRLARLDTRAVRESELMKAEKARGDWINYENAKGHMERMVRAENAHLDMVDGFEETIDENGNRVLTPKPGYPFHSNPQRLAESEDLARYNAIHQIMEGSQLGTQIAMASAAQMYDTERKVLETKMQKYQDLTVPTKEIDLKMEELTRSSDAIKNIDPIIASLRVLNQRGDKDLVRKHVQNVLEHDMKLGSHASQALGNFLMFEVGGADPFLRRFGKYINLETAMIYSAGKRHNPIVTLDEMVKGEYEDTDPETGESVMRKSKMNLAQLMQGTPLDSMERKALDNLESVLQHANTDGDGRMNLMRYLADRKDVEDAMGAAMVGASSKFLAGSDELKSIVAFKTGFGADGKARWEEGGDLYDIADVAEEYFRNQTIDFFVGQTPKSLLATRSEFKVPLTEHLSRAYLLADTEGWSDADKLRRDGYLAELANIRAKYGDNPEGEQAAMRDKEIEAVKDKMAGAEFRRRLAEQGTLGQIYQTRKSGAANNAKDWLRRWLNLDDETAIRESVTEMNNRRATQRQEEQEQREQALRTEAERRREEMERMRAEAETARIAEAARTAAEQMNAQRTQATPDLELLEEPPAPQGGFDDFDRQGFVDELQRIYNQWSVEPDVETEEFYDEAMEYLEGTLHDVGEGIRRRFESYWQGHPNANARELLAVVQSLVQDESNY